MNANYRSRAVADDCRVYVVSFMSIAERKRPEGAHAKRLLRTLVIISWSNCFCRETQDTRIHTPHPPPLTSYGVSCVEFEVIAKSGPQRPVGAFVFSPPQDLSNDGCDDGQALLCCRKTANDCRSLGQRKRRLQKLIEAWRVPGALALSPSSPRHRPTCQDSGDWLRLPSPNQVDIPSCCLICGQISLVGHPGSDSESCLRQAISK